MPSEAVIGITGIGYGVHGPGDRDDAGGDALESVKLQGVDHRIRDLTINVGGSE